MPEYAVHPVTPDRWNDLVALFGSNGARDGCWCMWSRIKGSEWQANAYDGNKAMLERLVADKPPGLLAYQGEEPVGWVALGPRSDFGRLNRSPVTKPVDETPVWSITCFYIKPGRRRSGIGSALLEGAVAYAAGRGAAAVEGYPIDKENVANADAWWGRVPMFTGAGFTEVARRSPTRPVMRRML